MVFNPQIDQMGNRDWSGTSRGTGPDRSFEALFSGLAETGIQAIQNQDAQTQTNIEQEARGIFEQTNTEFGFDPPPSGMTTELERITALQNALDQGKISQVNYYGRLATLSKQLRSKYPRYESIVDSTIQSVTGTRPANAYRDAMISEMQSLADGASASAKERRSWESQNAGIITSIFGEEYWDNPEGYDLAQVQSKVGLWKAETESIDANLKRLQHNAQLGDVNREAAGREADRTFSFTVTSALNRVNNGAGFNQMVSDFIATGGEGLDQFSIELTQTEASIRNELLAVGQREFVQTGLLSMEDLNKRVDAAMAPIAAIKESMLGGNFDFATRMVTINNDIAERGLNDIYTRFPEAQIGAGISKMNPYAGAEWMTRATPGGDGTALIDRITNIAVDLTGNIASGAAPGGTRQVLESGDQRVSRATLDTFFNVIRDPNAPPEHVSNLVEELFGTSVDFMSTSVVSAEDLEQIYTRFLAPEVTAAILEKGTPEDLQKYTDWAFEKFRALPNVRAAAGDLSSFFGSLDPSEASARYDPQTNRIEIRVNESSPRFDPQSQGRSRNKAAQELVGTFNRALAVLDPIAKANGVEMEEMVNELVRDLNRVEEGASDRGVFGWLADQFSMSAAASEMPEGTLISGIETPDTDLDFLLQRTQDRMASVTPSSFAGDDQTRNLLDMIGEAEGAGYNTLYSNAQRRYGVVPTSMTISEVQQLQRRMGRELGSSAFGKYQIMQSTLRDAVKAMGLSGDEVFTPELQDRIATEFLLPRRGYDRYRRGEMSSSAFLRELANEWASIPTRPGGRSAYHGDRMNNRASGRGNRIATLISGR